MKFSDFPQAVIKENVDYTVKEITNVIKKYGPRESGNENCYAAQKHIKKEMDTFCDGTEFESYKMAPKAFLHFTKLVSVVIFLAVVACAILMYTSIITPLLAQCIVCGVVFVGLFITVMEFLLYKQFMDPLYKKIEAHNLMGVRKPRGEVKRRIVISGHIDAAYEWRHLYYGKKVPLMAIFMSWTIGGAIVSFILSVIAIVANFVDMGTFGDFMINYSYIFHFVTALGMVTLFMFVDFNTISPGANDNLTGTYAAVCALRMLDMAGVDFENTEVCAMITDGEEAGLRGAKAWCEAHKGEFDDVPTIILSYDTIHDPKYLMTNYRDLNGTVKADKAVSDLFMESAADLNIPCKKGWVPPLGGATDSAAFAQAGFRATGVTGLNHKLEDYYHTRRDTYDNMNLKGLADCFAISVKALEKFDNGKEV